MRIYVAINPVSWGGKLTDRWVGRGYNVKLVSEAIAKAKTDKYFAPFYKKIRDAGYRKMSFSWGVTKRTAHRHGTHSFDVPRL